ncbi:hypothetical protein BRADI_3g53233v3 [Brachypodium distachyon]|uniref:Uncharacterized protein n=1 Tax=Brachypodium distachyon TaxID=15368 RepID=A0A2K2D4V2_BRADI|nr:hypothetical protein BRADI_3g53233v3 [Brachypodium distachyon]
MDGRGRRGRVGDGIGRHRAGRGFLVGTESAARLTPGGVQRDPDQRERMFFLFLQAEEDDDFLLCVQNVSPIFVLMFHGVSQIY